MRAMNGELCVVTGATSGIGKAAASALARMGAQVVLVARDRGRGEAALAEVAAAGGPPPRLEIADLSAMGQVRELAGRLGADTVVYLASSPEVADETGGYYIRRRRREPSAIARDDAAARRLWQVSEELTGLAAAGQR